MTITEIENRIEEIRTKIFYLNMTDRLWGKEKEEWENLHRELNLLYAKLNKIKNNQIGG